jgi:signal transduction histidine kinase
MATKLLKLHFGFVLLFSFLETTAQNYTKKQIDSINQVPYHLKIENTFKSEKTFLNGLSAAKALNYKTGIADSYANLATIYFYQGKYELSQRYNNLAIKEYSALKRFDQVASLYAGYGYHMKRRDFPEALRYMQKGIKLAEKNNVSEEVLSPIYDNYGVLKEMNKEFDSAYYFYRKSLELKEKVSDSIGIPYSLNKIGMLQLLEGKFAVAKENLDRAYSIRLKINDKIGIAENLNYYGSYYYEINDFKKSKEYFIKALEFSKRYNYGYLKQENLKRMAEVYEVQNNYKEALEYFKKHIVCRDSISDEAIRIRQAEMHTKFDTEEKEKQILLQRAELAEKNTTLIIAFGLFLISVLIGYFVYNRQKMRNLQLEKENQLKDALLKIETQNRLQEQRLQISRDLHDNIGSQLTFIISSIDNLKYAIGQDNPKVEEKLTKISAFTRETIAELRDTIWAMNKDAITIEDLEARISNFIENAKTSLSGIQFEFKSNCSDKQLHPFSSKDGMNMYRIIQEAVNNAIKHAEASRIQVEINCLKDEIQFQILDNGKGMDDDQNSFGNGLTTMRKRANELHSELQIQQLEKGTAISFQISNRKNFD